jgi:Phosphotransferase enzyme family
LAQGRHNREWMGDARARFEPLIGEPFEISRRDTRWLAMGDEVVAFAADDEAGWKRLQREKWLIERWRAAGVPACSVVREDETRRVQIRERLHGVTGDVVEPRIFEGPFPNVSDRLDGAPISAFGRRLAESYGELARRIRGAVSVSEARAAGIGMTSRRVLDIDDVLARLHASSASPAAKRAGEKTRGWLAALPPVDAVIHGDLHFHNMCLAEDGSITGVFDVEDAGIDAAATELLYIESIGPHFAATVVDAYGPISIEDVRRAHIRVALGHLIWFPPGTPRHASVVSWITAALERLAV